MTFDEDKTPGILQQLRASVASGNYKDAVLLLRHADAGGRMRADPGVLRSLRKAVGEKKTSGILDAMAFEVCRYCQGGRGLCEECEGKGVFSDGRVCRACAGFGLVRCPFCNGTALAGYDFVPRGLRPAVLALRLAHGDKRINDLSRVDPDADASPKDLVRLLLEIDRYRGILANAIEQVRIQGSGASGETSMYSSPIRSRILARCEKANDRAEEALRSVLDRLAKRCASKAERLGKSTPKGSVYARRATAFGRLSTTKRFDDSPLATPRALRGPAVS
ncbi:MAG: hypothetical protein KF745_02415 [Phycisphaeraceae bacterium]|nr:hypothetical protein [Phycisphaeraceae bacterium]